MKKHVMFHPGNAWDNVAKKKDLNKDMERLT
jgi:hypothetical protein